MSLQASERDTSASARRSEREPALHLPTTTTQALYWLYPKPHCGQQGEEMHS